VTSPAPQAAGFTLVEVLLALLIGALVMLGSYSVTSQIINLSDEVRSSLAAEDALEIVRLTLGNDLGSIIWVESSKQGAEASMAFFGGRQTTALSGQDEEVILSLASAASLDPGAPFPGHAFHRVEYLLRKPPEKTGNNKETRQLVRRELPAATLAWRRGDVQPARETVLLEAVTTCAIQFFDNTAVLATWDSRARQQARQETLPTQVRLEGLAVIGDKARRFEAGAAVPSTSVGGGAGR
jgi:general secretion pathway protein J